MKIITTNKKAYYDWEILETFEVGIVLVGKEIKAIRAGKVSLQGSFARVSWENKNKKNPEIFLYNAHIENLDHPTRTRKLLLKRQEIDRLIGKVQEKKLSLIPLKLYLKRGLAKIELALARGKTQYDKRQRLKEKHRKRTMEREF